jgi:hypothetical protein
VASSYGFSETDETMTAETITPNQLTLQALTSDEEECIVDDLVKDPASMSYMPRDKSQDVSRTGDNVSLSSDNGSGDAIPIESVESRTGMHFLEYLCMINLEYNLFFISHNCAIFNTMQILEPL